MTGLVGGSGAFGFGGSGDFKGLLSPKTSKRSFIFEELTVGGLAGLVGRLEEG